MTCTRAIPFIFVGLIATAASGERDAANDATPFRFRMQEIDKSLKVGYAVLPADINGDGKKDIVVVDTTRVIWFENPSWKMRTIIQGQTKPDNVCIDAYDIDGDGQLDLALGAEWKPFNTKDGGTLQWLRRGKTLDEPWTVYPIDTEPTVHRIRFADLTGLGRVLVVAPLMGRGSTREKNWMDGEPVRLLAYKIPKDPIKDRWTPEVIDQSLHVVHNFHFAPFGHGMTCLFTASYEGVHLLWRGNAGWERVHLGEGNQDTPKGSRGASEIKLGWLGAKTPPYIATIEPWHGHQVVVYTPPENWDSKKSLWRRQVIDEQLKWGHAVSCADLNGDGSEELIIGVRDALNAQVRSGVNVYRCLDGKGEKWQKQIVDNGGVAVEDLAAADLDNDGKIDLVAVGRATGNVRIYWNETK